jgi:hypothetical protein
LAIKANPNSAQAYYDRSVAEIKTNYNKRAIEDFNMAKKLDPNYAKASYRNQALIIKQL